MASREEKAHREHRIIPTMLVLFGVAAIVGVPLWTELASRQSSEADWLVAFQNGQPDVRAIAAFEAARAEAPRPVLIHELGRLLADSSEDVRREAVWTLVRIGQNSDVGARAVTAAVDSVLAHAADASVRLAAAQIVGAIGPRAIGAASTLARALDDSNVAVRAAAVSALGQLLVADAQTVSRVDAMARDSDADISAAAVEALAQLRHDEKTTLLLAGVALRDPSAYVRLSAVYALAASGSPPEFVATTLAAARGDPAEDVRQAAERVLRRLR